MGIEKKTGIVSYDPIYGENRCGIVSCDPIYFIYYTTKLVQRANN